MHNYLDNEIIEYYKTHSGLETLSYFKDLTNSELNKILLNNNISHHNNNESRRLQNINNFFKENNKSKLDEIISYFNTHSNTQTKKKYNLSKSIFEALLDKYNLVPHNKSEAIVLNKVNGTYVAPPDCTGKFTYNDGINNYKLTPDEAKLRPELKLGQVPLSEEVKKRKTETERATKLEKYGNPYYNNIDSIIKNNKGKYFYDNIYFDSSWELALWIYAKDHNEEIEREPLYFIFKDIANKSHRYYPDFKYKGDLIEVKGSYWEKNKGYENKKECMLSNGVKIWYKEDVQFALNYVKQTYGTNYLSMFK